MSAELTPADLGRRVDSAGARAALQGYCELLQAAGARTNLVGTLESGRIWDELLLDAVASWSRLPPDVRTVADVGSGAGLPGLVWALLARVEGRDLAFTLIEPRAKRVEFLQSAIGHLGLVGVRAVKATVGGYVQRRPAAEAAFDLVTSRAVFPLSEVVESQQALSGRYQLVHASVEDLALWQAPAGWRELDRWQYGPAGARPRAYVLIVRA